MEQHNFCCLLLFIVTTLSQSFCCGCWNEPSQWDGLEIFCTYLSIYLSFYLHVFTLVYLFTFFIHVRVVHMLFSTFAMLAIYVLLSGRWRPCADPGIFVRGVQLNLTKKALTTFFFNPQLILLKSNGIFRRKLWFFKVPEGVQHFPGVPTF